MRQSTTPVQFSRTTRRDDSILMTSGRAGKVVPVGYIPLLRGDAASGRVGVDIELAEMPRPLRNAVLANVQAWFVPKTAHPQFSGADEFMHAYQGEDIKSLGASDRTPPDFFNKVDGTDLVTAAGSEMFKTLGLHVDDGAEINSDLIDAFWLVYNFRLAAHSSRLARKSYASEDIDEATTLPPALWPTGRFSNVVPDYERALIVGALDLDVTAGSIPVSGIAISDGGFGTNTGTYTDTLGVPQTLKGHEIGDTHGSNAIWVDTLGDTTVPRIFAEMENQAVGVTLADIDKARTTQAFAKLRTAYAGNDATGFDNDDAIVAELMQGFRVPDDQFKRPWLLDSKRVTFGMSERHATDAANLDASVSVGMASALLSLNVPQVDSGGVILFTVEVLPERLDERQSDEWVRTTTVSQLPDALRDVQRPEPVDMVLSRRLDARHTDPESLYGYEPMNNVWNRATTRLGGNFYQADPEAGFTEQRNAIWQTEIIDPVYSEDHFIAPVDFPHDVFADTEAPAFEVVARHTLTISGLTQIGDVLAENNDDYEAVEIEES